MSEVSWIPTSEEIVNLKASLDAINEIFVVAGELAAQVWRGSLPNRGNLRNRIAAMFESSPPKDRALAEVYRMISKKSRKMLLRLMLVRQPVICVGEDDQELRFRMTEDFETTANLSVSPDDGSMILRLELRLDERTRLAVTRSLVWEENSHAKELSIAADAVFTGLVSVLGNSGVGSIDIEQYRAHVRQALSSHGVPIMPIEVSNPLLTTAAGPIDTKVRVATVPLVERSCLTAKVTMVMTMIDGQKRGFRVENPFLVARDGAIKSLADAPSVKIPMFYSVETHPRHVYLDQVSAVPNRNMRYDGSTTLRHEKELLINRVINDVFVNQIGFTRDEVAFIFMDRKLSHSPVSRMRPLLIALIGEVRKDMSVDSNITKATRALLPLDESKRARYEARLAQHGEIREGKWDDAIDLPALNHSLFLMAELLSIFPLDVARYMEHGNKIVGPDNANLGYWNDSRLCHTSRKRRFIVCCFDIFSRRSNPWTWMTVSELDKHSLRLDKLIMANLHKANVQYPDTETRSDVSTVIDARPTAKWDDAVTLSAGRTMLNDLASADHNALRPFALQLDDWSGWMKLTRGDERQKLSRQSRSDIDSILHHAWKRYFPSFAVPHSELFIAKIRNMVSILARNEVLTVGGHWMPRTFVFLAVFFWLVKRYPSPDASYALSPWELDVVHQWALPFENRSMSAAAIRRHEDSIRIVYDRLLLSIAEFGWTIESLCGSHLSPSVIAELKALHNES